MKLSPLWCASYFPHEVNITCTCCDTNVQLFIYYANLFQNIFSHLFATTKLIVLLCLCIHQPDTLRGSGLWW